MRRLLSVLALVGLVACSSDPGARSPSDITNVSPPAPQSAPTSVDEPVSEAQPLATVAVKDRFACDFDLGGIREVLRIGAPPFEIDPYDSFEELMRAADAIVTGELVSVRRAVVNDREFDGSTEAWAVHGLRDREIISAPAGVDDIDEFDSRVGGVPDEFIAGPYGFDNLATLAFLFESSAAPSGWEVGLQGFVVGCDETFASGRSVFANLPAGARGRSVASLTQLVKLEVFVVDDPIGVAEIRVGTAFYPACGNETLGFGEATRYSIDDRRLVDFEPWLYADPYEAIAALPDGIRRTPRVASPGPGDDIGTLVIYDDDIAFFISDSGDLERWLTTEPLTYDFVC